MAVVEKDEAIQGLLKEELHRHREAGHVVNRHVPGAGLPALRKQLAERDKCRTEVRAYKRRAA